MAARVPTTLPLHRALEELDSWHGEATPEQLVAVAEALHELIGAFGARGAFVRIAAPPLRELEVGTGTLAGQSPPSGPGAPPSHHLRSADQRIELGEIWVDGGEEAGPAARRALAIAFDAAWSRAEARAAGRRLEALDQAVRAIAGVLDVDRVLQSIVHNVRELSDAQYAALGVLGPLGMIEAFITSGIGAEERAAIGHVPRGLGVLGLIIREGHSFRIDDITADPRRHGFPAKHPVMHSFLGVPVRSKGTVIGNLYLTNKVTARVFSESDQRLVEMFALHAGIAIENARLHEEVQRLAVVEERHRISQDLHDSVIQSLYAVGLAMEDLPDVFAAQPDEGEARVDRTIDAIHSTIRDIRNFILGLRPELLDSAELNAGLHALANEFHLNTMIDVEVRLPDLLPSLPPLAPDNLLAMTREALSNIARHSGATRASIELTVDEGTLRLIIGDNGRGFDRRRSRTGRQHGLTNLQARAEALGGSLVIHSEEGAGTQVEALIPIAQDSVTEQEPGTEQPAGVEQSREADGD